MAQAYNNPWMNSGADQQQAKKSGKHARNSNSGGADGKSTPPSYEGGTSPQSHSPQLSPQSSSLAAAQTAKATAAQVLASPVLGASASPGQAGAGQAGLLAGKHHALPPSAKPHYSSTLNVPSAGNGQYGGQHHHQQQQQQQQQQQAVQQQQVQQMQQALQQQQQQSGQQQVAAQHQVGSVASAYAVQPQQQQQGVLQQQVVQVHSALPPQHHGAAGYQHQQAQVPVQIISHHYPQQQQHPQQQYQQHGGYGHQGGNAHHHQGGGHYGGQNALKSHQYGQPHYSHEGGGGGGGGYGRERHYGHHNQHGGYGHQGGGGGGYGRHGGGDHHGGGGGYGGHRGGGGGYQHQQHQQQQLLDAQQQYYKSGSPSNGSPPFSSQQQQHYGRYENSKMGYGKQSDKKSSYAQLQQQQSTGFNPNAREFVPYPASSTSSESGYTSNSPPLSPNLVAQFGIDPTDDQLQLAQAALKKNRGLKPGEVPSQCVWVGNVASDVSKQDFRAVFEQYGQVTLIRMFPRSKCAFVTFQKSKSALASLELEGKQLGSMCLTLNVGKASRHLWVGNIGAGVTEDDLRQAFSAHGTVESVRVLRANKCAFVNFASELDALKAAEEMNGVELGGQTIVINFQWAQTDSQKNHGNNKNQSSSGFHKNKAGPTHISEEAAMMAELTGEMGELGIDGNPIITTGDASQADYPRSFKESEFVTPSRQLFIGNILSSVTEEMLVQLFSRFGELETIKSFTNRGYAFVVYRDVRVSAWVRDQMTMYPPLVGGRALVVNFGRTMPSDRMSQPQMQPNPQMQAQSAAQTAMATAAQAQAYALQMAQYMSASGVPVSPEALSASAYVASTGQHHQQLQMGGMMGGMGGMGMGMAHHGYGQGNDGMALPASAAAARGAAAASQSLMAAATANAAMDAKDAAKLLKQASSDPKQSSTSAQAAAAQAVVAAAAAQAHSAQSSHSQSNTGAGSTGSSNAGTTAPGGATVPAAGAGQPASPTLAGASGPD